MHFLAFSSDFCLASPSSQQVLLFKSFTGNNMRAYRVKNNVLHTLIQKVEFDRKSKRRYELFELEAKLSGRWLPVTAATLSTATMSNDMGKKEQRPPKLKQ
jgi:hypothetical protein